MNQKVSPWVVVVVIAIVVAIAAFVLMRHQGPGANATDIENAIKSTTVTSGKGMPGMKTAPTTSPAPTTAPAPGATTK